MRELIRTLTQAYGPSGAEEQIRAVIQAEIKPLGDEIQVDPLGSLIAHRPGGTGQRIALCAHMDEIGVMVTFVDEKGFARFTNIGGVSSLTCVGARVAFADGKMGVIGLDRKRDDRSKIPRLDQLYIDVGATSRDDCPVQIGDTAVFVRPFIHMEGDNGTRLVAKAMDDRIGCAVLIETMRRLEQTPHDVYFIFSVQEEVGLRGAGVAAYGVDPDIAIAVDVTSTGDTPESFPMPVELGKGPAVKIKDRRMISHPMVRDMMIQRARQADIPFQREILEWGSTDAAAMQLVRAGVPAGCISVPCRHIHTPSEMVDEADVENSVRLLLEVLQTE